MFRATNTWDMHAALAASNEVVDEGLPGPAFAGHMLNVDPPDHTRLRRLVVGAFSVRRIDDLRPQVQAIPDDLLDDIAAQGPDRPADLVASFAFPISFTLICELLGVPTKFARRSESTSPRMLGPTATAAEYGQAKGQQTPS